jgi:hypothetical protein
MSPRTASRVALAAVAVAAVSVAAGLVLFELNRGAGYTTGVLSYSNLAQNFPGAIAFLGMGALLVSRRPENALSWLCLTFGLSGCVGGLLAIQYAAYVLVTHPGSGFGGGLALAVVLNGSFAPLLVLLIFVPLIFPTGRLLSRRWLPIAWLTVLSFGTLFAVAITTTPLDSPFQHYENPIAINAGLPVVPVIAIVGAIASVVAALSAVVIRFRRSRGDERAQLKWLVVASAFLPIALIAHTLSEAFAPGATGTIEALWAPGVTAFPIAIGIAVLKYRLYEIDRIISRALVYGSLTVVLAATYVGLVLGGQAVFSSFAGGSNLAVAASTLVVAALFLPVRSRVQRFVDRRFYRRRYDAQRTLEAFGARLREQVDLDTLSSELRLVVGDAMQPVHVSLWLQHPRSGVES